MKPANSNSACQVSSFGHFSTNHTLKHRHNQNRTHEATARTRPELPPEARLEPGYIRYVRILPHSANGPDTTLRCATRICLSSNIVSYDAVSYTWGNPLACRPIIVDGHPRLIADNLYQFLQQAKNVPGRLDSWLWIYALCIDQTNAAERMHQVGLMAEIFGRAAQVVVWLGPRHSDSDIAMQALSTNCKQSWDRLRPSTFAVWNLCARPYWMRLWVFQELKHARSIVLMCGDMFLAWEAFEMYWVAVAETDGHWQRMLAARMVILRASAVETSLWELLEKTRDLNCADPRDKVYALLSVASEGHEGIEADYRASVTLESLAHRILCNKHATEPPASLETVVRQCQFLNDVLGWTRYGGIWSYGEGFQSEPDVLKGSDLDIFWHDWATFHGHRAVARLPAYPRQIRGATYSMIAYVGSCMARGARLLVWWNAEGEDFYVLERDLSLWWWIHTRVAALYRGMRS